MFASGPQPARSTWRLSPLVVLCLAYPALAAAPKVDWLFPAGAGRSSQVTVKLSDVAGPVRVWIDDSQGVSAEPEKEHGKIVVKVAADAVPGVRWLRFHNDEGASVLRPFVVGALAEVEEKEPNNAEAQAVTCPVVVNGRLEKSGDVDAFRVSLKRGQTLVASMLANETLGSPMDGVLQVCDAAGFVLAQNDETHGLDPQIVFTVPRDGDYIVRCFAFPATPDSSINFAGKIDFIYRLTLTTGGFIDHAMPLAIKAGQSNELTLVGWNVPGEASRLTVTPEAGRDQVTLSHAALANALRVPVVNGAVLVAAQAPPTIALPAVITGHFQQPGGENRFRFTARKGDNIRLGVESQSLGFPLDAVLRVVDATGKQLAESDDGEKGRRDPSITFKPAADGEFVVSIRDLHGRGGFRFVYRLTMELASPDFALTMEKDSVVAASGKAEVIVAIDRQNGFADDIALRIEGLPAEATVQPATSKMKDASEKSVKFSVASTKGPAWSGPIRVVAESGALRRAATFATVAGARHEAVWLTLPAGAK